MAKNIFVHGDFKKLRSDFRRLKKDEEKFSKNLQALNFRQKLFRDKYWTTDEHSIFLQEQYFLTKQQTLLDLEQQRLENSKISLENRQSELDSLCEKHDSQKQIQLIAAGILNKNLKFVRQLEDVENRRKDLLQQISHIESQLNSLRSLYSSRRGKCCCFTVLSPEKLPDKSSVSLVSLIADAILREPEAVQLVAYCPDNPLEMEKTWSLMSELDKDALIHKEMVHDL